MITEKRDCIKRNKDIALIAFNHYLDSTYNLIDKYFDIVESDSKEDSTQKIMKLERRLKEGLSHDPALEKFILDTNNDAIEYEKIRSKILNNDFNLSLVEIARVGVCFNFLKIILERQNVYVKNSLEKVSEIMDFLIDKETENVDFSNKS